MGGVGIGGGTVLLCSAVCHTHTDVSVALPLIHLGGGEHREVRVISEVARTLLQLILINLFWHIVYFIGVACCRIFFLTF